MDQIRQEPLFRPQLCHLEPNFGLNSMLAHSVEAQRIFIKKSEWNRTHDLSATWHPWQPEQSKLNILEIGATSG